MDVFTIQRRLVDEYKSYVESFVSIRDPQLRAFVNDAYEGGRYWPEALVQLNPAFAPGEAVPELVSNGTLAPACAEIFRVGKDAAVGRSGSPMRLHKHQQDALYIARTGESFVLTTGTGSGKSLSYFIPIVDRVLRTGGKPRLAAIVVYPMNALCNSQLDELGKFLGPPEHAPVTYARYTGQETEEERNAIRANPPHILLTNYVMLELILTRIEDQPLLDKAHNLEFLVLDELHTYRGRQGADVAMLVRRLRERSGAIHLQCIGTSATLATEGSRADRQAQIARVASSLFGDSVRPDHVIGETLEPLFPGTSITDGALTAAVSDVIAGEMPNDPFAFLRHPLAAWIEATFGIRQVDGRYERVHPITLSEGAEHLSAVSGVAADDAANAIRAALLRGYSLLHPGTGRPIFAFRLHQFISRGDTVFSSLELGPERYLTLDGQTVAPKDRERKLYPLAFCRACGEAYFTVDISEDPGGPMLVPREFRDLATQDESSRTSGYLWLDPAIVTGDERAMFQFQPDRVPDRYLTERGGEPTVDRDLRKRLIPASVETNGRIGLHDGDGPSEAWFIKGRLPLCLHCGESWEPNAGEFTKLGSLASEGRAGATTLLSLKLVQALRGSDLPDDAKKLLSFTDNRQDASLQAGHFNDFIVTSMLRAGILASLPTEGAQTFDTLPDSVLRSLNLAHDDYAAPGVAGGLAVKRAREAFRDVLAYRIFRDLKRGWRVNQPNLEQLKLLTVEYEALDDLAHDDAFWRQTLPDRLTQFANQHRVRQQPPGSPWAWLVEPALAPVLKRLQDIDASVRMTLLREVLEQFRREMAIRAPVLDEDTIGALRDRAANNLNDLWGFDESERLEPAKPLRVAMAQRKGWDKAADLTPMSKTGREIAKPATWGDPPGSARMPVAQRLLVLHLLTRALAEYGYLTEGPDQHFLLAADVLQWRCVPDDQPAGDGVKPFFRQFYETVAAALPFPDDPLNIRAMRAREHTAQVPADLREEREKQFSNGTLPVLYCSPTMELGVDISSLNAVNMRNVPPTPANYAQRSGRAGRANQPAIVVTYCAANSPHDQYYFAQRQKMVAGVVSPPRIDLANRDLIASHMHAVWLAETGQRLHSSLQEVFELADPSLSLPLKEQIAQQLANPRARERALARCERILQPMTNLLQGSSWFRPEWLGDLLRDAPESFDRACDRWRTLFRSATRQIEEQHKRSNDLALTADERRRATRLRDEAQRQRDLLIDKQSMSNDFYSYRYLASEGFLPGYNFPRLPLTAFIPGRHRGKNDGEYLQRSRFIAVSEYGPGNSIYYEGSRYRVERISMPTSGEPDASITETIKVCNLCGYAHTGKLVNADVCVNPACGATLGDTFVSDRLLRLQNVITRRIERINSEEEERVRQGFDLKTAFQFGETPQGPDLTRGEVSVGQGGPEATLLYAPAARVWRVNLGWRRRKDKSTYGFYLDMNKGIWSRKEDPSNTRGDEEPEIGKDAVERVVPYVNDRQNSLLLTLGPEALARLQGDGPRPSSAHYLSLGYALKRGICIRFQLEDDELAMELLPDADNPHGIFLTESSEGGAGVLSRLIEEPNALAEVARAALEVCHFDPETGEDLGAQQDCGIACYHCLLSYGNQKFHRNLNRLLVRELLLDWRAARVLTAGATLSREQLRDELKKLAGSTLESEFIDWLYAHGYRLPDRTQVLLEDHEARPDFVFDADKVCVYVDGPAHEHPETMRKDQTIRRKLERKGWQVVSVTYPPNWPVEIGRWPDVFGEGVTG